MGGIQAVKSHCKSVGHKKMTSHTSSMDSFVVAKTKTEQPDQQVHGLRIPDPPKQQGELQEKKAVAQESPFLVSEAVTKAEIGWAFKMVKQVKQHWSANSCSDISELFKCMFEDSEIVKKFSVGKTKVPYMIMFGLAPYFKDELTKKLLSCSAFVVCFDEALNRVIQQGQMDIFIRYYDDPSGMVVARYFGSAFLGHSTC